MSEKPTYKIYSPGDCIPEQTLYDYIDHKLSAKEQHRVEKHMLDCELCSDALEGLRMVKDRQRVAAINQAIREKVAVPEKVSFDRRLIFSIAAGLLLLLGGVFIFNMFTKSKNENKMADVKTINPNKQDEAPAGAQTENGPVNAVSPPTDVPPKEVNKKEKEKLTDEETANDQQQLKWQKNTSASASGDMVTVNEISADMDKNAADGIAQNTNTAVGAGNPGTVHTATTNAPPAPVTEDKKAEKDAGNRDDSKVATKSETQNTEAALAKQQAEKRDERASSKGESKKKEETKEPEQKPAASANSGYVMADDKPDNSIALDSVTTISGETEQVYSLVDKMPEFPGGEAQMMKYIRDNLKYPALEKETDFTGTVYAQFIVDKKGNIKNAKIFKGQNPAWDKEVLRMLNSMPKWTPGKLKGTTVNVLYTLPVKIELR